MFSLQLVARSAFFLLYISLAMAKKFFCGSCGHEVVHEVFEEGNCLSCRILLSGKLKSVSDGREPVSYSKDTQTPPDGNGDMHRFIRALLLRRPDAAIDKAVKENRWKDAYELEVKYHMEAAVSITSGGPVRFATPAEARPPPCTNDEYVEYPFEPHIRVTLHGPKWKRQMPHAHGSNKIEIYR